MKTGIANFLAILIVCVLAPMVLAQDLTLPQNTDDPVVLRLPRGTPKAEMLRVYLSGAETPIAGRVTVVRDQLSFDPAFGFEPGQDYVAHVVENGENTMITFRIPEDRPTVPAVVTEIYPSGDTLPENTLRFYIHFSVPMQPHVAFDFIKLRDASGNVDNAAFMKFKQELWNEDRTRLTILIDPGRIKREVATNVELGPALLAGQEYALTVEGGWPTADGKETLPFFSKPFTVSDALRTRPDTRDWTANAPCAGTRAPLDITFDRPFDRHLMTHAFQVKTEKNQAIEGEIEVKLAEHNWRLTPHQPWPAEILFLFADPTLEDVAGNNFHDLLDHVAGIHEGDTSPTNLSIRVESCGG